jgi:alkylation response protein AidB-like acyl-CoA dehydrogenase
MDFDESAEEAAYRAEARAWLSAHATLKDPHKSTPMSMGEADPEAEREHVRQSKAWQRTLFEGGWAGITWPKEYGGRGGTPIEAIIFGQEQSRFDLPTSVFAQSIGMAGPTIMGHGTEAQKERFLEPMLRGDEVWCQLFSEPGAGSDLASLGCRAERDGDEWVLTGQKVWNTWAHLAHFGVLLARTNPDVPKRRGITYFLVDMHAPGVEVRPLRHITGEVDFNEVFLDATRVPDFNRVGSVNAGWKVGNATLSGERQMVSGSGSGGVDRIGGSGAERLVVQAKRISATGRPGGWEDPLIRQELMRVLAEERIRNWTNQRIRARVKAGRSPGPESSVGKVHQGSLNQRMQALATRILGAASTAWMPHTAAPGDPSIADAGERYARSLPYEVKGMLRSRANTIEGGTTEVNKNIIAERVLGLPREPDQWADAPWRVVPRS